MILFMYKSCAFVSVLYLLLLLLLLLLLSLLCSNDAFFRFHFAFSIDNDSV